MHTLIKALAVAAFVSVSTGATAGVALAGGTYHWAYPEGFQSPLTVPSAPGGSGIPEQYR